MTNFNVDSGGLITIDTATILNNFQEVYKTALGNNLNLDSSTPQGQLITNDVENTTSALAIIEDFANSFNVYSAVGQELNIAGAFFGYYRKSGTASIVIATVNGLNGTIIPAGSVASDGINDFVSLDNVEIGTSGKAFIEFQCSTIGAIECVSGALKTIITPIQGWDSITNINDAIVGNNAENDNTFRNRITANQLNIRAITLLGSIIDRIAQLTNVIDIIGLENPKNTPQTINGKLLKANSIYLCILGGASSAIAKTLTESKTLGCATNGNNLITYYDKTIDFNYNFLIDRPKEISIAVQITYSANEYTTNDVVSKIQSQIINYIQNNPFKIGQAISANILDLSINSANYINLLSFKVSYANIINYVDYLTINIDEIATLTVANITTVLV